MSSRPFESYPIISEMAFCPEVPPGLLDQLWAHGWRHFGPEFFRNSVSEHNGLLYHIQPLRVPLAQFQPGKRFRKILRRNSDLRVEFKATELTADDHALFLAHKARFKFDPPETLEDFLGPMPSRIPCENVACRVYEGERLVAVSFLDVGERAGSSVYASFDLERSHLGLGYFTMLMEIEFGRQRGWTWYYPGYAYHEPSFYDYKKRFRPFEWLDWRGGWRSDVPEWMTLNPGAGLTPSDQDDITRDLMDS
jgi:arginine-tRNA-protein transferase